jgi:shikimate kinase
MKIYLIGMPGSGKTTLGKKVASELSVDFVDLDAEIEKREAQPITEIFSRQGEDHFRKIEAELLREWAGSAKSFVMATGGGAPCFYNSMEVINQTGISIFLDVSVDQLLQRVQHQNDRPLLKVSDNDSVKSKLEGLMKIRLPIYGQAHHVLKNPTHHSVLEALRIRK